jgi:hypothetical protein
VNHYDLLGLSPGATPQQIRSAYRSLAMLFHPDRLPPQQLSPALRTFAEERLRLINAAYSVLSDPDRRAGYDLTLSGPAARRQRPASADAAAGTPPAGAAPGPAPAQPPQTPSQAGHSPHQQRAWLNEQIADVEAALRLLTTERDRVHAELARRHTRTWRRYAVLLALTTLGSGQLMLAALGLAALAPEAMPLPQRLLLFAGLAAAYEYAAVLLLVVGCAPHSGGRLLSTARATLGGLAAGAAVGAVAWAVWRLIFFEAATLPAILALGLVFALAHLACCWAAAGSLTRLAHEQRRLFDQANAPMLRMYRSHLEVLQARRQRLRPLPA